ncbi:MAG: Type IV pilus assembly protein PilM, partial [Leuconostoc sp. DORA_2]
MRSILKKSNIKVLLKMNIKDFKLTENINFNKVIPEKKKKVVAFDLGSSTIKIVEGTYYKNELTIDKYIKIPSPKDAVVDGEIKKDDELAIRISEVLKSNNIKAKHGICTTNS